MGDVFLPVWWRLSYFVVWRLGIEVLIFGRNTPLFGKGHVWNLSRGTPGLDRVDGGARLAQRENCSCCTIRDDDGKQSVSQNYFSINLTKALFNSGFHLI